MNVEDRLRDLRPDTSALDNEWPTTERDALLRSVLADQGRTGRSRFVARHRPSRRIAVPLAAAAVAVLMAGLLFAVMPGGDDDRAALEPLGEPFAATSTVDTPAVGPGQYAFRATTYYETVKGKSTVIQRYQDWTDRDGNVVSLRSGGRSGGRPNGCFRFPIGSGPSPTELFASLPADPDALRTYLRREVSGSSSRDEAVFVAVGDMLRAGDLFATSALRAALVEVLSRTGGVKIQPVSVDPRGHTTVRADFVDPNNRPGQLSSLYFEPNTFQLVAETARTSKAAPSQYASQSYEQAPSAASVPDNLPAPTSMTVLDSEKVVDAIPTTVRNCE